MLVTKDGTMECMRDPCSCHSTYVSNFLVKEVEVRPDANAFNATSNKKAFYSKLNGVFNAVPSNQGRNFNKFLE